MTEDVGEAESGKGRTREGVRASVAGLMCGPLYPFFPLILTSVSIVEHKLVFFSA